MPPSKRGRPRKASAAAEEGAATAPPYHHGDLRKGLLEAAERILVRDGIAGLTLRAAAREAGVSHAAPKNHFGDLTGLLSELAATGFERFNVAMAAAVSEAASKPGADRMSALGAVYVRFARANPGLFLLMFRGERLDFSRPALSVASTAAIERLAGAATAPPRAPETKAASPAGSASLSVDQAAKIVAAWSMVHGLALLSIDGRLKPIVDRLPPGATEADLLAAIGRARV